MKNLDYDICNSVIADKFCQAMEDGEYKDQLLAATLGCTLQEIAGYKKGQLRIVPDVLFKISEVMDKPLDYFFEGVSQKIALNKALSCDDISDSFVGDTARAFVRITNPNVRKNLIRLVASVADDSVSA